MTSEVTNGGGYWMASFWDRAKRGVSNFMSDPLNLVDPFGYRSVVTGDASGLAGVGANVLGADWNTAAENETEAMAAEEAAASKRATDAELAATSAELAAEDRRRRSAPRSRASQVLNPGYDTSNVSARRTLRGS